MTIGFVRPRIHVVEPHVVVRITLTDVIKFILCFLLPPLAVAMEVSQKEKQDKQKQLQ